MKYLILFLACGFAAGPGTGIAQAEERVMGVPNFRLENPSYGLHQFVLGSACLSLPSSSLDLSCNPAFLATEHRRQFRINTAFNDHIKDVNFYRERLQADDSIGIVDSVLSRREPVAARATTALWYQRDWWAVGAVPIRGGFGTLARNPAYPQISADIYKESEVFAKAGFVTGQDPHLQVGGQLRYTDRDYLRKQFDLLDALSDPDSLKVQNQKQLFLEPGMSYSFDSAWASSVSATMTQLRVLQTGSSSPFQPVLDIGFATAPPFLDGKLRTTTHYTDRTDQDLFTRLLWAAIYDFTDVAAVSVSLGKSVAAIGLNGHIDSVVLGIGYRTEEIAPDQWQSQRVSTMLFEAGLVF